MKEGEEGCEDVKEGEEECWCEGVRRCVMV